MKKLGSILLVVVLALTMAASLVGCGGGGNKLVIEIDGGGDTGNYNTSTVGQYSYNELEVLIEEWEKMNPEFNVDVQLRRTSYGGDPSSLLPLLRSKRAPDIIYQNGALAETHIGNDYYVVLDDYFEQPNPYNGNKPWKEVYADDEFEKNRVSDGHVYFVNMERLPIGIMYNKTYVEEVLHEEAPETFGEFMALQKKIYDNGKIPFLSPYPWTYINYETNVFADLIAKCDVIRPNGSVDMEEQVRAYKLGLWNPDSDLYRRYIEIICQLTQYQPKGGAGYDAVTSFLRGDTIMIEAVGEYMRQANGNAARDFEIGVIGYPYLTTEDLNVEGVEAGGHCYRGCAGLGTAWWVTQSAERKGTTEACIDLLMFLTSPQYNNRMVGKLEGAIPLDPNYKLEGYLQPMNNMYNEDRKTSETGENKNVSWGAFNSWNVLGYEYNTFFLSKIQSLIANREEGQMPSEATIDECIDEIVAYTNTRVNALITEHNYKPDEWPPVE